MAFTPLNYSKDWTNADDFPTFEGSESQVRADIQLLHNEAKTALNNLITALESLNGAGSLGAKDSANNASTVQAELDARVKTADYSPVAKTDVMTQPVGKASDGKLYTTPFSSGVEWGGIGGTISNQTDLTANFAGITHTHGNITNDGKIGSEILDNTLVHVADGKLKTLAGSIAGMQIEIIGRAGTGAVGTANPCSQEFSFTPKYVSFFGRAQSESNDIVPFSWKADLVWGISSKLRCTVSGTGFENLLSYSGNTLSWSVATTYPEAQFNSQGYAYYIVAIG